MAENQFLYVSFRIGFLFVNVAEIYFSISATKKGGVVVNQIGAALVERIVRAGAEGSKFKVTITPSSGSQSNIDHCLPKVVVVIPEVPGFAGDIKKESSIKTIMAAQYRTINRGGSSIYEEVRKAGYDP